MEREDLPTKNILYKLLKKRILASKDSYIEYILTGKYVFIRVLTRLIV